MGDHFVHSVTSPQILLTAFEELGNPGWNWDLLKKYYMKVETFVPPSNKTEVMSYDLKDRGSNGKHYIHFSIGSAEEISDLSDDRPPKGGISEHLVWV